MDEFLIQGGSIVSSEGIVKADILLEGDRISRILPYSETLGIPKERTLDATDMIVMPGVIDTHVHFREPGMTRKGDIDTESKTALLGGVTSYIDMPNTNPPTISAEALLEKKALARGRSWANYGFHIGATKDDFSQIAQLSNEEPECFAGIKVFLGSSTGNLLLNSPDVLERFFGIKSKRLLVHAEDEALIQEGLINARSQYGESIPPQAHPLIRSRESCLKATSFAINLARKEGTKLHLLHISTADELELAKEAKKEGNITLETSANYLWFSEKNYAAKGNLIKCNPAIKTSQDREALRIAVQNGLIDSIGSDHAPHLLEEKLRPYLSCPSGIPSIGESLKVMLSMAKEGILSYSRIAQLMCEAPAKLFGIPDRGRIKEGYLADILIVDPNLAQKPNPALYHCGWTPYSDVELHGGVRDVFLSGKRVVADYILIDNTPQGKELKFKRL